MSIQQQQQQTPPRDHLPPTSNNSMHQDMFQVDSGPNNNNGGTKSILSEINIDELFLHYPAVFEELFYSNTTPFKWTSIEQIEQDLRALCEQHQQQQQHFSIRIN